MAIFQKSVFTIVRIIFVITIIVIIVALRNSSSKTTWPPILGDCPDFWTDLSGNGAQCVNVKDLGTCNSNLGPSGHAEMDFSVSPYTGSTGLCAKFNWANNCGLVWDGINSGNGTDPCTTTTTTT